ncbi:MAG: acetyltransferase [Gemmatimonadaceae bacterium]|nr:acetyltransferase [Gemmatimonadaceae bacterium]
MRLIIVGAGGFGREVLQYVRDRGVDEVVGFVDDRAESVLAAPGLPPWLGSLETHVLDAAAQYVIGIGKPSVRAAIASRLEAAGAVFGSVVHPTAYVPPTATLGRGCVVAPGAHVGPYAVLGDHAVLNVLASVGHDACIGRATVFSPYAVINGAAQLGDEVFLGTHATVLAGVRVGTGAQVSAGAVVYREVEAYALAQGDPARSRVMFAPAAPAPDAS